MFYIFRLVFCIVVFSVTFVALWWLGYTFMRCVIDEMDSLMIFDAIKEIRKEVVDRYGRAKKSCMHKLRKRI